MLKRKGGGGGGNAMFAYLLFWFFHLTNKYNTILFEQIIPKFNREK